MFERHGDMCLSVVSQLDEIIGVTVAKEIVRYAGTGYQVNWNLIINTCDKLCYLFSYQGCFAI